MTSSRKRVYKSKNIDILRLFYCIFGIYIKFATFQKKTQPHRTTLTLFFSCLKMYDFFLKKGSISWEASALNVLTGTKIVKNLEITPKNWFLQFFSSFYDKSRGLKAFLDILGSRPTKQRVWLTRSVRSTSIYVFFCENDVITQKSL